MFDHIGPRTLPQLLTERAERWPDKVAMVFEDIDGSISEYTFAQLAVHSARAAAGLGALGIEQGDKVVIHLANCPEFVIAFLALSRLGAVGVPSNTANRVAEMTHVVGFSDARCVITSPEHHELFEAVGARTPIEHLVLARGQDPGSFTSFDELLESDPAGKERSRHLDSETPIEIIFTSGTTSRPKGVVLTHANWLWSGERGSHWLRVDDRDRLLTALPLFHVNAQSFTLMSSLTVAATAIFLEQFSASRFIEQVRRHGATQTSLVAMMARTLMTQPVRADDAEHKLRRVSYAINVDTEMKEAFERRYGVELLNGYGLSEAMTEVSVCPVYGAKRWPSIGQPAFGRDVRLVDGAGNEVRQGEVGEITVRGAPGRTIMKEYYKDPEATAQTIVDGWLHTGDSGYFDEAGYLYFFDRIKDVIKRAGENVSASEVEVVLSGHPDISAAAVVGIPDPIRDEAVMAFVVPRDGATLTVEDVRRHCSEQLAHFKVPTEIAFMDFLPVTSIGKIEKRQLRDLAVGSQPVAAE